MCCSRRDQVVTIRTSHHAAVHGREVRSDLLLVAEGFEYGKAHVEVQIPDIYIHQLVDIFPAELLSCIFPFDAIHHRFEIPVAPAVVDQIVQFLIGIDYEFDAPEHRDVGILIGEQLLSNAVDPLLAKIERGSHLG